MVPQTYQTLRPLDTTPSFVPLQDAASGLRTPLALTGKTLFASGEARISSFHAMDRISHSKCCIGKCGRGECGWAGYSRCVRILSFACRGAIVELYFEDRGQLWRVRVVQLLLHSMLKRWRCSFGQTMGRCAILWTVAMTLQNHSRLY